MPRMTREGQAARGEGKQPLTPASNREGRQATEKEGKQPRRKASNREGRQATEKEGKQPQWPGKQQDTTK